MTHPHSQTYRTSAKPLPEKEKLSFEEKIGIFRGKIPGPIRRILGVILIAPLFAISFAVALLILVPISWVSFADFRLLDKVGSHRGYCRNVLIPGTSILFGFEPISLYRGIRLREIKEEE